MYEKGEWVIVFGGTFEINRKTKNLNFVVAKVIHEGLDDLFIETVSNSGSIYGKQKMFVSKKACRKVPVKDIDVSTDRRRPQPGDLVYYHHKDYKGKIVDFVGHVLEMKYEPGRPTMALVNYPDKPNWYSVEYILVLNVHKDSEQHTII